MTHTLNLGCTNAAGCNGPNATYLDHGTSCPSLVFTGANSIDAIMSTVAGLGYGNNIIFAGASYLNNSATPQYYGTQAWPDTLQFDCATNDPALTWQSNTFYLPGSYIISNGHYWQLQKTSCTNTDTNDIRCLSTNGAQPACFAALTSPCNDGTGSNQAQWTIDPNSTHAPPLDYWCDSNTTGNTQYDCYQLELSGTASISSGGVATVTVTNPPTYPLGQNLVVKNASISAYNCPSGCAVTAISSSAPWTVSYSGLAHSARGPDTISITPGGSCNGPNTFTACMFGAHTLNINTQNATAAILSHQLPVPWNQVMRLGRERMFAKLADHYKTASGNPAVGYFRVGLTKQGESNQDNITSWPCGSATTTCAGALATKMYNSYEKEFYSFMGGQLTVNQQPGVSGSLCGLNGFSCVANLNTTPTVTAAYANANNVGFDNNAMGTNHGYTLDCYAVSSTPPSVCGTITYSGGVPPAGKLYHGGDWASIFSTYNAAQPNTFYPVTVIQTTNESTPGGTPGSCRVGTCANGSCTSAGVTGAMALDPGCVNNQNVFPAPNGFPGNWPLEQQYLTNSSETYSCDVLLMLDTAYSSSHCQTLYSQATYQTPYQAAAVNFLTNGTAVPAYTTPNSATFTAGALGMFTVGVSGFPIPAITETGSLPSGVTLIDNRNGTATISGTPGSVSTTTITIHATNSVGITDQTFTLTVSGNQQIGSGAGSGVFHYQFGNFTFCGPPLYLCGTISGNTIQLDSPLPTWGDPLHGASGTSATTHEFDKSTTLYRMTNLDNNCAITGFPDGIVSISQAEDENHSSYDDRLAWFGGTGAVLCMYLMDSNTMALTKVGRFSNTSTVAPSSLNFAFSSSTPSLLYALNGNASGSAAAYIDTYDFTGASGGSGIPAPSHIFNYIAGQTGSWGTTTSNCLPSGYTVQWTSQFSKSKVPADVVMAVGFSRVPLLNGTATVANGSTAVSWTGPALPTDGTLLLARITLNGALCSTSTAANCYFIASNTTNTITLSEPYVGTACATSCTANIPSGQNSGVDVVAYRPGHGCVRWQTNNSTVTGDWQISGGNVVDGSWSGTIVSLPDTGTIHGVSISLDGQYVRVGFEYCTRGLGRFGTDCTVTANSTPYIWQIGTLNLAISCDANANGKCGGHGSMAFSHMTNASGAQTFQETVRPIAGSPNPPTDLKANLPTCHTTGAYLSHDGLNNMDSSDTGYYFETSYNTAGETGTPSVPFDCAFMNEVDLTNIQGVTAAPPGGQTVREAHTYNSGLVGTARPQCNQAIAGFSQSGKYIYWETDGMGAFGSTTGGSCTYSTPTNGCRCEIVGMKAQ